MAKKKTKGLRDLPPDHDFTFPEEVTGIIHFNDKNVVHIVLNTDLNEIVIAKLDAKTGQIFRATATLEEEV